MADSVVTLSTICRRIVFIEMLSTCEKVTARLQSATAGHARLVLSKTVPFFCTTLYVRKTCFAGEISQSLALLTFTHSLNIVIDPLIYAATCFKGQQLS